MTSNEGSFTVIPNSLLYDKNLTITEKGILSLLLSFYNKEQQRAWPSTVTLADISGLSRLWVSHILTQLEEKGYIRVEKRAGQSARYEILTCKHSLHANSVYMQTELTGDVNSVNRGVQTEFTGDANSVSTINTNTKTNKQELSTNTKTPAKIAPKNESNFEADFEDFWKAYPKPKNPDKTPGRQKYIALRKKGVSADDLLRAAQNYAQAMRGTDPRYIKHCKTFLGPSDAWRDYLQAEEPKTAQQAHEDGEAEYMRDATAAGLFSLEEYRAWRAKNGF